MERVTQVQSNIQAANKHYRYNNRGNMIYKTGGYYMYYDQDRLVRTWRPYSPTVHLTYDANGNQTQGLGHTITWNAFNKPSHVSQNGHTSQFYYDANHKRTQQIESRRDGSRITTQYVNANYQRSVTRTADGTTQVQGTHTLFADGQAVSIHVRTTTNGQKHADQFRYLHRDPLDSVDTITDGSGQVQERLSYGPFGQRRQANGQPLADLTRNPSVLTTRGYTNHEHLDQVQLIHMNARLYDPITARFLSPDTMIPWPTYSQAHNRYIYVMNNPLKYNDPTGHMPDLCGHCGDDVDMSDNNDTSDSNHQNTTPVVVINAFQYNDWLTGGWDAGVGIDTAPNNNGYSSSLAAQYAVYGSGNPTGVHQLSHPDYVGLLFEGIGFVFSVVETGTGAGLTIISGATMGTGVGAAPGAVGMLGGTAMTLHGFHGSVSGFNGIRDAWNGTKTAGPLEQIGKAIGGEKWGNIGNKIDQAISLRGWAKGAWGLMRGSGSFGDIHSASKGVYDNVIKEME